MDERERLIVARATLALLVLARQRGGGDPEIAMIRMAVRLGQLERRPLDISSIAAITGIPRPTVSRKLRLVEDNDIHRIGRRSIPEMTEMSPESVRAYETARVIIERACCDLEGKLSRLNAFVPK